MVYKYEHDVINELEQLEDEYKLNYKNEADEVREVYRKAKSFDELVNFYPQKDEIPSDEFFMMMGYIIEGYKDELKEVHSKAKAFDEIKEFIVRKLKEEEEEKPRTLLSDYDFGLYQAYDNVDDIIQEHMEDE